MKTSSILGLNARSAQFLSKYNPQEGRKIARSKILSARILKSAGIPTPKIVAKFRRPEDIIKFDWGKLGSGFALKPSKGLGGEGIIVVKKRSPDSLNEKDFNKLKWITTQKNQINVDDIKLHILDIIEGAYSLGNVPDVAFIQEYVGRHKAFRKYAYRGTPDVRIIVFNKVPVMAMLRLPTKQSGGRANLHQGALAVGVDIATGITTKAYYQDKYIEFKPGTKRKLNGIKIPNWETSLTLAVKAQEASKLGYVGVDIVIHPEKGPMVLELNSQPGLQIQLANRIGLKRRLDKVEDLEVISAEHGVKIARALFSERFASRVKLEGGVKTINIWELVYVVDRNKNKHEIPVKIDTGAWSTSIDSEFADKLGLIYPENIIAKKKVQNQMGSSRRKIINLVFYLSGRRIKTVASLAKRHEMRVKMIVGRRDLTSFLVKFDESEVAKYDWYKKLWIRKKS